MTDTTHAAPAAAPAADASHAAPAKKAWWENGFYKAGVIFFVIIAFGFGLGSISQEVNNFINYVLVAFFTMVTNFKSAILLCIGGLALLKWAMS